MVAPTVVVICFFVCCLFVCLLFVCLFVVCLMFVCLFVVCLMSVSYVLNWWESIDRVAPVALLASKTQS